MCAMSAAISCVVDDPCVEEEREKRAEEVGAGSGVTLHISLPALGSHAAVV